MKIPRPHSFLIHTIVVRYINSTERYLSILIHPKISILLLVNIQIISTFKPSQKTLLLTFLGMFPGLFVQRRLWVEGERFSSNDVQIQDQCASPSSNVSSHCQQNPYRFDDAPLFFFFLFGANLVDVEWVWIFNLQFLDCYTYFHVDILLFLKYPTSLLPLYPIRLLLFLQIYTSSSCELKLIFTSCKCCKYLYLQCFPFN